jgi:hypothetical protein
MLQRCLETPPDDLSPAALAAATAAMETADPLALIELGGACPHCGHAWTAFLDVAAFVWREVQHWAQRTLQEVHLLARAYGWARGRNPAPFARAKTDLFADGLWINNGICYVRFLDSPCNRNLWRRACHAAAAGCPI